MGLIVVYHCFEHGFGQESASTMWFLMLLGRFP